MEDSSIVYCSVPARKSSPSGFLPCKWSLLSPPFGSLVHHYIIQGGTFLRLSYSFSFLRPSHLHIIVVEWSRRGSFFYIFVLLFFFALVVWSWTASSRPCARNRYRRRWESPFCLVTRLYLWPVCPCLFYIDFWWGDADTFVIRPHSVAVGPSARLTR